MYKFSKRSMLRMQGVHPELILIMTESIRVSPIDFGIPPDGGVRTAERQNEMFNDITIKTHCDGYDLKSNHQIPEGEKWGEAVDIFAYLNGKASWDKYHLAIIAGVILSTADRLYRTGRISIKIRWGGTFASKTYHGWDYPHFEIISED